MSIYFADTSAFAKRYIPEVGSTWVQSWIEAKAGHLIVISGLSTVEFVSLLARRHREGTVSLADFNRLRNDFLFHASRQYRVMALTPNLLAEARQLIAKHPLRALDAIQLASALASAKAIGIPPIFVSADQKLLTIAAAEGFTTDDPNLHP